MWWAEILIGTLSIAGWAQQRLPVESTAVPYGLIGELSFTTEDGNWAGHCTATLIGPRRILTAGHCAVIDTANVDVNKRNYQLKTSPFYFYPGMRGPGTYLDYSKATLEIYHIDFTRGIDWAIFRLDKPLGEKLGWLQVIRGMENQANSPAMPAAMQFVGYAGDSPKKDFALRQYCEVLGIESTRFVHTNCVSHRGSSGGPLMAKNKRGNWRILFTLSGGADRQDRSNFSTLTTIPGKYLSAPFKP